MARLSLFFTFIPLIFTTCTVESTEQRSRGKTFFDLERFLNENKRADGGVAVTKTVTLNGAEEIKEIEGYPLQADLDAFSSYNINRPALLDKYSVDSVYQGDAMTLTYQAIDSGLKVRSLQIKHTNHQVNAVEIRAESESFLEDAQIQIIIQPESGYSLHRTSHKIFQEPIDLSIQVQLRN